jgi:autotransporter-associated beta strand protein
MNGAIAVNVSCRCAALLLCLATSGAGAEKIWIRESSGNWSTPTVWSDNAAPPFDGATDLTLRFRSQSPFQVASTHNLGATFLLNQIALEADGTGTFLIGAQSGKTLRFTGASPKIAVTGFGAHTISIPLSLAPTSGVMSIGGTGSGDLTLSGNITQTVSGTELLIDAPAPAANAGVIALSGTNTFSGGVTLQAGNLAVGNNAALGTGTLRVKGGTLRFLGFPPLNIANGIALENDLEVVGTNQSLVTLTGPLSSVIAGTGLNLRTSGTGRLILSTAASYSGATKIDYNPVDDLRFEARGGILNLLGGGSLLNTSSIDIASDGLLYLNGNGLGTTDRIADTTPITVRSGRLLLSGSSGSNTERIGGVVVQGFAMIGSEVSGSSGTTRLTATSLGRAERGTVDFHGTNLGILAAANRGSVLFDTAPLLIGGGGSGPATSIIPFAIGDITTLSSEVFPSLVTYDGAGGVRTLKSTEYEKALPASVPTSNVWLDSNSALGVNSTANALRISNGATLGGTGALSLTSGVLLATTGEEVNISAPLDFGSAEAQIFALSPITLSGVIAGSNGLTKSGHEVLRLRGLNNVAGPLTINAGAVEFEHVEDLGTDSGTITINGPNGALTFAGAGNVDLSRPIRIASGMGRIAATSGVLEISGPISGEALHIVGNGGTVRLAGANTHSGPTVLGGDVIIDRDEALGSGELRGEGTLHLAGPWISSRRIALDGSLTIDTSGHDSTLSGLLNGRVPLTKSGAGTLSLTAASPFAGSIQIAGGTLRLSGEGSMRSGSIRIASGGRLLLDYSGGEEESRLLDTSSLIVEGGELALAGNPNGATREQIGGLSATRSTGALQFSVASAQTLTLAVRSLSAPSGTLLIPGEQLAAPAGQTSVRVESSALPATASGLIPGVFATWPSNAGETFTTYNNLSDAGGVLGVTPLRSSDYVTAGTIQNSTMPATAHVVAQNGAVANGTSNTIASLTFDPGGNLSLAADQTVTVSSGQILVRSGGPAALSGGTLVPGTSLARLTTLSDILVSSAIMGLGWTKIGPGILTLDAQPPNAAPLTIASGPLRVAAPEALSAHKITLLTDGVFDLNNGAATVGEIAGDGTVAVGTGALRLGTLGTPFVFTPKLTGTGAVTLVDNGRGATRTFPETVSGFNGSVVLESGEVTFLQSNHVSLGPLVFAGGGVTSLRTVTFNTDVLLSSELKVDAPTIRFVEPGSVSGTGSFHVTSQEAYLLTPAQVSGPTVVESSLITPNLLSLSSEGALINTSAIQLRYARLNVTESDVASSAMNARIPDAAPITIELGTLSSTVGSAQPAIETIGALHAGPGTRVEMEFWPTATTPIAGFAAATLERQPGGTLLVTGVALGEAGATPHHEFRVATPPALIGGNGTGANRSLLPWAVGGTDFERNFLTWEAGSGLRPLDAVTEFVAGPAAVQQPTNNLRTTGDYVLDTPLTVNALLIDQGTSAGNGSGRLTITSGGVLLGQNTTISHPLDFGSAEGLLHLSSGNLTLAGLLTGTGGLTVSGGQLTISGTNLIAGPLHIERSRLIFNSVDQLGAGSSIILSDGGLSYTGNSLEFTRDLEVAGFTSFFGTSATGTTIFSGDVTGSGRLRLSAPFGSIIHLTGTRTHLGGLEIGAIVTFASDAALGPGPITLADGLLRATFPWTTDRTIFGAGTFDTNGFDVSWTGYVEGVEKIGAGTLTLGSHATGSIEVREGTLMLDGPIADGTLLPLQNSINVRAGGRLAGSSVTKYFLDSSGTVAPGKNVGTLSMLNTTFRTGSTFAVELSAFDLYDRLQVQGSIRLEGDVALHITLTFDPVDGVDSFVIVDNDGFDAIDFANGTGAFLVGENRLTEGETFSVGSQMFSIKFTGGTGNDVVLYAVPEPACGTLALSGALALVLQHRRRFR